MIDRAPKTTTATLIDVGMAELEDKFFAVVDQRYHPRPNERVKLGSGGLERLDWTAPEAKAGREWTGKSDVWSLGLLLHRLLTGKRPTTDADGDLLSPCEVQPRCSRTLASAVLSALNPDPHERVNAVELLELLDLAAEELAEETCSQRADPESPATTATPKPLEPKLETAAASPSPRRPRAWARAGMGAVATAVLLVIAWQGGRGGEAVDSDALGPDEQVAGVKPLPPPPDATQAAVVTPPPSTRATLLASSDPPTLTMREALAAAAADLRRCSALVRERLLVIEFMTAQHRDSFAAVTITSRTSADVDHCVSDATAGIRFQPPQEPQLVTEEYTP